MAFALEHEFRPSSRKFRKTEKSSQTLHQMDQLVPFRLKTPYEIKYLDSNANENAFSSSVSWTNCAEDPGVTANPDGIASPANLCSPIQGTQWYQRVGRKIQVRSITVNCRVRRDNIVGFISSVRLMLVQDKQTNGTAINTTQVMNGPSGTTLIAILAQQNVDYIGRYTILDDKLVSLVGDINNPKVVEHFQLKHTFKKPVTVRFNNTSGGKITSVIDNSFHIIGNSQSGNDYISYFSRVEYIDA